MFKKINRFTPHRFFWGGGINKADKALASLTKNKQKEREKGREHEKTYITKIRNKRSVITKDLTGIKRININNSMPINSTILDEMDQFLEKQKLSKFTQEEIDSMNSNICTKEIESVVK